MADDADKQTSRDAWDKLRIVATAISLVATPVVLAVVGNYLTGNREVQTKTMELAIDILKSEPRDDMKGIRRWSVDVLSHYSQVDVPQDAAEELTDRPLLTSEVSGYGLAEYIAVKGSFRIVGYMPDGDSVRFKPDSSRIPAGASGRAPRLNSRGECQLRLEGVDAPEVHFAAGGAVGTVHQSPLAAQEARDGFLKLLNFSTFVVAESGVIQSAEPQVTAGYMLTRGSDLNGRCNAFVFAGEYKGGDGDRIALRPKLVKESVNAKILRSGLAYPSFDPSIPDVVRWTLAEATVEARASDRGVWQGNMAGPATPIAAHGIDELQQVTMWPKLFRRLASYFASGGTDLAAFPNWLRVTGQDEPILLAAGDLVRLSTVIEVKANSLRLTAWPEEIISFPESAWDQVPESISGAAPDAQGVPNEPAP